MARSPRRRIPLASVADELTADRTRLDSMSLRQLDTSHGCQNHTLLPYANAPLVLRRSIAHEPEGPPCNSSRAQRLRVHRSPHSTYRDDAYAPLHEAGWREDATDLREMRSDIFLARDLDDPNRVERVGEIRALAQRVWGRLRGARAPDAAQRVSGALLSRGLCMRRDGSRLCGAAPARCTASGTRRDLYFAAICHGAGANESISTPSERLVRGHGTL